MSEVEMMYRNAHVYPKVYGDITKENFENKAFNMVDMCDEAFTAEKQLELIKWMIKTNHRYFIQDVFECEFEESLAKVLNLYWQDLTEQERTEIKRILEL